MEYFKEINDFANDWTPPEIPMQQITPMQQMMQDVFSTGEEEVKPEEIQQPKTIADYLEVNKEK